MAQTTFDRLRNLLAASSGWRCARHAFVAASLLTLAMLCGVALQDAHAACPPNPMNCQQPSAMRQQPHPVMPPQPRPIMQQHPVTAVQPTSIPTSLAQNHPPSLAPAQPQAGVPVGHAHQSPNAAIKSESGMPLGTAPLQAPMAHALAHSGAAQIAMILVPSLRGMSIKAAQQLLEHQHLSLAVMDHPGKGFTDEIINQTPAANTRVEPGARVSVYLRPVEMRALDKPEDAIAPAQQAHGNERLDRRPRNVSPGIEAGIAGAADRTKRPLQYDIPRRPSAQTVPLSPALGAGKPALQSPNAGSVTINIAPKSVVPPAVIGIQPAPAMPAPAMPAPPVGEPMPAAPPPPPASPAALAPVAPPAPPAWAAPPAPPAPPAWAASPKPPAAAGAAPASPRTEVPSGADTQKEPIMAAGPGPAEGEQPNLSEQAGEAPPLADAQPPVQGAAPGPLAAAGPAIAADVAAAPPQPALAPSSAAPSTSTENTSAANDTSTAIRSEPAAKSAANPPAPPVETGENLAPPSDNPTQAAFASVDRALDSMPLATAVFNVPTDIDVDEDCPCRIDFVLDARQSADAIAALIKRHNPAAANFQHDRVRIYYNMEASLTAQPDDFSIDPGPEKPYRQAVSETKPTTWTWYVTPKRWGVHRMRLALYARIPIEGKPTPVLVQTFDKNITVTVTPWSLVRRFVLENWKWLWVTLLIPLGQLVWKNRRRLQPRVNTASVMPPRHHHRHHAQMHRHGRK
ncbi:PASTA domain-containing protein [Paraburkholderia sp. 31.1]|uniref:PASTA domain-containing protein n=1 Tax=Paraburkholderia sp. 31.1 TaxID=2615205 RepID=UPI001655B7B2|nr:PASTA domain-containing protein [Paraburkholderia sp. 31.1]MBC8724347.1 PASTA domain-containing protein [Paraburkholderia sp. 31.1]